MAPTPSPTQEDFTGFANSPVDEDGKVTDSRDVAAYDDQSEAGKILKASREAESSIVAFRTDDRSTNGAPAAVVPPETPEPVKRASKAGGKGAKRA